MHFLSITWIAWMAATVALYWILPPHWRDRGLIAITLTFLLVHAPDSAAILCFFTVAVYYFSNRPHLSGHRTTAIATLVVSVLVYCKTRVNAGPEDLIQQAAIPLGLSYYSFRCLHYLIEKYKGTVPRHDFEDFVRYLLFLPTIAVGPIHRFGPFVKDTRRKRWDSGMLSEGMERILYGYVKIAVLANYLVSVELAQFVGTIDPENKALIYYLEVVRGGLNLYLQFSGFSDIAIGFALLLGYRVIENFDWPYLKKNISEFWRSWHISLTSWCRDYIYTTVISVTRSPALGSIAALVIIGLWHEISYRWIVWGIYHGLGLVVWQNFQHIKERLPKISNPLLCHALDALSTLATVHFVWFSFVIVRQPDLASVITIYKTILLFWR